MILLSRLASEDLYKESLDRSAYISLNEEALGLWKRFLKRGFHSLLPGSFAILLERLSGKASGEKALSRLPWKPEYDFFSLDIWDRLHYRFTEIGEDTENQGLKLEALHRLLQFMRAGISQYLQFNTVGETEGQTTAREANKLMWEEEERRLVEFTRRPWINGPEDELPLFQPQLFPNTVLIHIHRIWETLYKNLKNQFSVQPLQDPHGASLDFTTDPEIQMMGGYNDIELKGEGNWTALLPSELVFMENGDDIDYFDAKFTESELLFFRRDEGAEKIMHRKVIVMINANTFRESIRSMGRMMAWIELVWHLADNLFKKDEILFEVQMKFNDAQLKRQLISLLDFRINRNRPSEKHHFIKSPSPVTPGKVWFTTKVAPGSLSFEQKDSHAAERQFLANLKHIYHAFQGGRNDAVPA